MVYKKIDLFVSNNIEPKFSNISEKLLYYVSIQAKNYIKPTMLLRKGKQGEYFMDKLNPKYWDERYYHRKNFSNPQDLFANSNDPFFKKIDQKYREEEIKKEKESFTSPDNSAIDKTILRKRGTKNIENKILNQRLKGIAPRSHIQESLFENLQFSEISFCEKFLKKLKNK